MGLPAITLPGLACTTLMVWPPEATAVTLEVVPVVAEVIFEVAAAAAAKAAIPVMFPPKNVNKQLMLG